MTMEELSRMYAELVFSSARERNELAQSVNDLTREFDEQEESIDILKGQLRGKQALLSLTLSELKSERAEKNQLSDKLRQTEDTIERQRNTLVELEQQYRRAVDAYA